MCGIIAYIGDQPAQPILVTGLKRLEYRGYDSCGISLINTSGVKTWKSASNLSDLENQLSKCDNSAYHLGLAHTRWATHGGISSVNAHPHFSMDGDIVGVHNGVIENYLTLKKKLQSLGYEFKSDTDTEVVINFIHWIRKANNLDLITAVRMALPEIAGACVLVLYSIKEAQVVAINKGGQLCVGKNGQEYYIASDHLAFAGAVTEYFSVSNDQLLVINQKRNYRLITLDQVDIPLKMETLDVNIQELELGGFSTFMLKEIFSQPEVIINAIAGRAIFGSGEIKLGGLEAYWPQLLQAKQLTIIACGTSWYAGLLGKYWLEELADISVKVEYASEFTAATIKKGDLVIAISQSGETADTLAAMLLAKNAGAIVLGISNRVGSAISRQTDAGIYIRAGVELGVASTKAFTAQSVIILLITLKLAKDKAIVSTILLREIIGHLEFLPELMQQVLATSAQIRAVAEKFKTANNFLYLGRHYNYPVAMEGALKLKEISYIHAEGLSAGEMKHGSLALVDANMPVVMLATKDSYYSKIINNASEIKARNGKLIILVNTDDDEVAQLADELIIIPFTHEVIAPLLNIIPLQLLAYHLADFRGCNVDRPRNLAKSVTVQ